VKSEIASFHPHTDPHVIHTTYYGTKVNKKDKTKKMQLLRIKLTIHNL